MATSEQFARYVVDQLGGEPAARCRKMFGDYGVYCGGKFIGCICDDRLYVKMTPAGLDAEPLVRVAPPYPGAKEHFAVDLIDDAARLRRFVEATCTQLDIPQKSRGRAVK